MTDIDTLTGVEREHWELVLNKMCVKTDFTFTPVPPAPVERRPVLAGSNALCDPNDL